MGILNLSGDVALSGNGTAFGNSAASWSDAPPGTIIQTVFGTTSAEVQSTTTSYAAIGLNATITPNRSDSKILILASIQLRIFTDTNDNGASIGIRKTISGTQTNILTRSQGYEVGYTTRNDFNSSPSISHRVPLYHLDSPATTAAITYDIIGRSRSAAGNNKVEFQDDDEFGSEIILMEVAG